MSQFIGGPSKVYKTVTPNDSVDVFDGALFEWFLVGATPGNVVVERPNDQGDITITCTADTYYPFQGKKIKSTGTVATPIIAARN